MKWLRTILAVLLLGCCSLWVTSYWRILLVSPNGHYGFGVHNSSFNVISWRDHPWVDGPLFTVYGYEDLSTDWWPIARLVPARPWMFHSTFWLPTVLLAVALAWTFNPWSRHKRRAKQGLCIQCGYDLKGGTHERCPECGTEVTTQ